MPDLVSIVIPCYNQAHFLAEAIESALEQTYPHTEVLVVNDGSTDATIEVAARYARVRCITQSRGGLGAARNTGRRASRGRYLIFLDADDRLLPQAAQAGLTALSERGDAAVAVGHYRTIAADGSVLREWSWRPPLEDAYTALLRGNYVGMHATVLYRRSAVEEVGGFDTSLAACEDYDLLLRISRRHAFKNHGALVAEYRRHGANMSTDPALMLRTALQVHGRQWSIAQTRKEYRQAFADGQAFWRALYGRQLVTRLSGWRHAPGGRRAIAEGLRLLWRYYPRGLWTATARMVLDVVGIAPLYRRIRRAGRPVARRLIPAAIRRRLRSRRGPVARGAVTFGSLRRVTPISPEFGFDRGRPVDRYYIERFLERHAASVRGRVLEVGDPGYTRRFGGNLVTDSDVLHVKPGNPQATIVADLTEADQIPTSTFDCVILTQTLHLIYDVDSAVRTLQRILKPGGVALVTVPGISPISRDEWAAQWYWSFTALSAERLFKEVFREDVSVETYGNVLAATAFLYGLAAEELEVQELDYRDPRYPVIVAIRAQKAPT